MIKLGELAGFGRARREAKEVHLTRGDGCTGKRPFESYAEAEAAMGGLIKAGHHRPELGILNPYACRICRLYHIGHLRRSR